MRRCPIDEWFQAPGTSGGVMARKDPNPEEGQSSLDSFISEPEPNSENDSVAPLRTFDMPSRNSIASTNRDNEVVYHDLDRLYPNPPISSTNQGMVIHRAVLHDLTGIPEIMNWLADGEAAIVEMGRLMNREFEFTSALDRLSVFVEDDIGGQIVQITDSRLMLLPPGCRGVRGVDTEAFAISTEHIGRLDGA